LYDVFDLNVSNVSDCVKDGEAMIYHGLCGTGPFIGGVTAHLWGRSPPGPIASYGPDFNTVVYYAKLPILQILRQC